MRRIAVSLLFVGLLVAGAGCAGASQEDPETGLALPGDTGNGKQVVYFVADVSCDMDEPKDKEDLKVGLQMAATAAAVNGGRLEVGTVRALASQNIDFEEVNFAARGNNATVRISNAIDARDAALQELLPVVTRRPTGQPCESDLLGVFRQTANEHKRVVQRSRQNDLEARMVFVTNGLIVDLDKGIALTRTPIENEQRYQQTLKRIRSTFKPPDLSGFRIWLVGVGRDRRITTDRGPAVERLWEDLLAPSGADVFMETDAKKITDVVGD